MICSEPSLMTLPIFNHILMQLSINILQYILHLISAQITRSTLKYQHDYPIHRQPPARTDFFSYGVLHYNQCITAWKLNLKATAVSALSRSLDFFSVTLEDEESIQKKIVYQTDIIKISLQYCVILSQLGEHQISRERAQRILVLITDVLTMMEQVANKIQETLHYEKMSKKDKRQKKVNFKKSVISESKEKINQLLDTCEQGMNEPEGEDKKKQIIESLYCWENTVENNEKFMKKMLGRHQLNKQHQLRNILGINKIPQWIEQFNIGYLMLLQPKSITISPSFDPFFILSSNKILELSVYASVSFFTVSTEMRFHKNATTFKGISKSQKYLKMNEDSEIFLCKILHIKAIQIASKFIPSASLYINHLISSFNKNYKFFMEQIEQELSSHILSMMQGQGQSTVKKEEPKIQQSGFSKAKTKSLKSQNSIHSLSQSKKSQNDTHKRSRRQKQKSKKSVQPLSKKREQQQARKYFFRSSDAKKSLRTRKNSTSKEGSNFISYAKYQS